MNSIVVLFFLCVTIAVVQSGDPKTDLLEQIMECRRKNNLKDDDETHLASDSATKDHKCALACILTVSEMMKTVDGKPTLCLDTMEATVKAFKGTDEQAALAKEISETCNVEMAAITDECEYGFGAVRCLNREAKARNLGINGMF